VGQSPTNTTTNPLQTSKFMDPKPISLSEGWGKEKEKLLDFKIFLKFCKINAFPKI
jgi:hypothetical protein